MVNPKATTGFKRTACFQDMIKKTNAGVQDISYHDWTMDLQVDIEGIEKLARLTERYPCPICGRHRLYYCYNCVVSVGDIATPVVTLPIQCDVIKHWLECNGKSTALHAKILSPECVRILEFDRHHSIHLPSLERESKGVAMGPIHTYTDLEKSRALLLYPADATSVSVDTLTDSEIVNIDRVIFLDGTWSQVYAMNLHPSLQGIRKVQLSTYFTHFWRCNGPKENPTWLATIEAIYYFYVEYHKRQNEGTYDGRYDNLLFYFAFFHRFIQEKMRDKVRPAIA